MKKQIESNSTDTSYEYLKKEETKWNGLKLVAVFQTDTGKDEQQTDSTRFKPVEILPVIVNCKLWDKNQVRSAPAVRRAWQQCNNQRMFYFTLGYARSLIFIYSKQADDRINQQHKLHVPGSEMKLQTGMCNKCHKAQTVNLRRK